MEGAEEWKYDYDFSSTIRVRVPYIDKSAKIYKYVPSTHSLSLWYY